jgi:hypothetical protein
MQSGPDSGAIPSACIIDCRDVPGDWTLKERRPLYSFFIFLIGGFSVLRHFLMDTHVRIAGEDLLCFPFVVGTACESFGVVCATGWADVGALSASSLLVAMAKLSHAFF